MSDREESLDYYIWNSGLDRNPAAADELRRRLRELWSEIDRLRAENLCLRSDLALERGRMAGVREFLPLRDAMMGEMGE